MKWGWWVSSSDWMTLKRDCLFHDDSQLTTSTPDFCLSWKLESDIMLLTWHLKLNMSNTKLSFPLNSLPPMSSSSLLMATPCKLDKIWYHWSVVLTSHMLYTYIYTHMYMYVCVYMHIYMYVCIFITLGN